MQTESIGIGTEAVRAQSRLPDRTGRFLGLSKTGFHDVAYVEWGPADAQSIVLCVHGLTRQGRDFDYLAAELAQSGRRVICPDLVGRGESGRLRDPEDYTVPQYCADMNALIAHVGAKSVDWVGTSLGGLIGTVLAGLPGHPIRRFVINDIGPSISPEGLARIGRYVAEMPRTFASIDDAERYFREVFAPFGALSDEHWRHITIHSIRWSEVERRYVNLCDPTIVHAYRKPGYMAVNLWDYWDRVDIPMLIIRGTESDLLPAYTAREMMRHNKKATLHEVSGSGHAPTLMTPDQIGAVKTFLSTEL